MLGATLLVTGGTGAIGSALVARFASQPESVERIAVLTRYPEDPHRLRLLERWRRTSRIPVFLVAGDLTELQSACGLDEIRPIVTHVLHAGGDTSFTSSLPAARRVNVDGTRAILDFARHCPRLRAVACLSTVYVAGRRTGTVRESELDCGAGFVNAYEQSKFEMEELARAAMCELPVSVYRLSTVIGDADTGAFTSPNTFHNALRLLYAGLAPMIPGEGGTLVDVISSGFATRALHRLTLQRFVPGTTYHMCAGAAAAPLDDVLATVMETMRLHRPAWRKRAVECPAIVDLSTYELFVRSVEESGNAVLIGATACVRSFAYQLAYPKLFVSDAADAASAESAIGRESPLDLCRQVTRFCLETAWRAAA